MKTNQIVWEKGKSMISRENYFFFLFSPLVWQWIFWILSVNTYIYIWCVLIFSIANFEKGPTWSPWWDAHVTSNSINNKRIPSFPFHYFFFFFFFHHKNKNQIISFSSSSKHIKLDILFTSLIYFKMKERYLDILFLSLYIVVYNNNYWS